MSKKPWLSKTLWVNALAIVGMVIQYYQGWIIGPELQASILGGINVVLRLVTKEAIDWA